MQRYLVEAMPLGKAAVADALAAADLAAGRRRPVRGLLLHRVRDARAWTSCWPATWAWRRARSACSSGTWAATRPCPGFGVVSDFVAARDRPAVLLCLELTSLHVQPATADAEQIVSHALFADAAAAAVVLPGSPPAVPGVGTSRR